TRGRMSPLGSRTAAVWGPALTWMRVGTRPRAIAASSTERPRAAIPAPSAGGGRGAGFDGVARGPPPAGDRVLEHGTPARDDRRGDRGAHGPTILLVCGDQRGRDGHLDDAHELIHPDAIAHNRGVAFDDLGGRTADYLRLAGHPDHLYPIVLSATRGSGGGHSMFTAHALHMHCTCASHALDSNQ